MCSLWARLRAIGVLHTCTNMHMSAALRFRVLQLEAWLMRDISW